MFILMVTSRVQNSSLVKIPLRQMTSHSLALFLFIMDICPSDKYPLYQVYICILDYYEGTGNQSKFHPLLEDRGNLFPYQEDLESTNSLSMDSHMFQSPNSSKMSYAYLDLYLVSSSSLCIWTGIINNFEKYKVTNKKL